jgi:hypothetical protein
MNIGEQNRSFSDEQRSERRTSPRIGVSVPVESFAPGSDIPLRGATSDLSETGCYVETIFPFPIGTILEMSLQIDGRWAQLLPATPQPESRAGLRLRV